jgi:hypothetical protein
MNELKTPPQLEAEAIREYEALRGKCVHVYAISGYIGNNSVDAKLKEPVLVKVEATSRDCIRRWHESWLDPVMEVSIVNPTDEVQELRSTWVYGTARHANGSIEQSDFVKDSVLLRAEDRKRSRFIVDLIADGVTVTAKNAREAEDFVKEDAREFAQDWNYVVGAVRRASQDDSAGCTPGYGPTDATKNIGDLDFEHKKTGGSPPHYEFEIKCKPIVLAEDEADAIVQIVELLGPAPQADEEADKDASKSFRQRPARAGRIPLIGGAATSVRERRSRRAESGDASAFAAGLIGMSVLRASEATKRLFLENTGRHLNGNVDDGTPAPDACWMTLRSGKRILAEGPFEADIGMVRVWTPLEQEAFMLVRPADVAAIEFSE